MLQELDLSLMIYCIVLSAVLGAVFGSFLNCAAWRIAHKISFVKGKSKCPGCGHELSLPDLIPVFSWIFLKGKCRYCGEKVSVRYPLTELFLAAMSVLCFLQFGISVLFLRNFVLMCCLFCLSLVDMDTYEIPDGCLITAAAVWAVCVPFLSDPLGVLKDGLLGAFIIAGAMLLISLLFDKILGKESMGGGDIKLLFVAGLYLGLINSVFSLIVSCILGILFSVIMKKGRREAFPFGPAISISVWLMLLYGHYFTQWYLSLII